MKTAILLSALLVLPAPLAALDQPDPPKSTVETLRHGQAVTIAGIVEQITDEDEFLLRDETGVVEFYVGPNRVPALEGDVVTVIGTVDDGGPLESGGNAAVEVLLSRDVKLADDLRAQQQGNLDGDLERLAAGADAAGGQREAAVVERRQRDLHPAAGAAEESRPT